MVIMVTRVKVTASGWTRTNGESRCSVWMQTVTYFLLCARSRRRCVSRCFFLRPCFLMLPSSPPPHLPPLHSAVTALHPPFPLSARYILPIAVIMFLLNCPCSPAPSQCPIASTLNTPPPLPHGLPFHFSHWSPPLAFLFLSTTLSSLPTRCLPSPPYLTPDFALEIKKLKLKLRTYTSPLKIPSGMPPGYAICLSGVNKVNLFLIYQKSHYATLHTSLISEFQIWPYLFEMACSIEKEKILHRFFTVNTIYQ